MSEALRRVARELFAAAVRAVEPGEAVRVWLAAIPAAIPAGRPLTVIAVGKAAEPMLRAACESLRPQNTILVWPGPLGIDFPAGTRVFAGGHPVPNEASVEGARAVLALLREQAEETFTLVLLSGGGSALLDLPLDSEISLEELQGFHRALVRAGLPIWQMNTLRKHLSAVKGGRLAAAAYRAGAIGERMLTLLVSDVPAGQEDAISSGPALPDRSTVAEVRGILAGHPGLCEALPGRVLRVLRDPDLPETPKPGDGIFAGCSAELLLSSETLVGAAAEAAGAMGFAVWIDNTPDDWPLDRACDYLLDRLEGLLVEHGRVCLLSAGEVTVAVPAGAGRGGRNSHFALVAAAGLAELGRRGFAVAVLSGASDGQDGNSGGAGAVVDETTLGRAPGVRLEPERVLAGFDSFSLFEGLGDELAGGATGTNVRDLRILLGERVEVLPP